MLAETYQTNGTSLLERLGRTNMDSHTNSELWYCTKLWGRNEFLNCFHAGNWRQYLKTKHEISWSWNLDQISRHITIGIKTLKTTAGEYCGTVVRLGLDVEVPSNILIKRMEFEESKLWCCWKEEIWITYGACCFLKIFVYRVFGFVYISILKLGTCRTAIPLWQMAFLKTLDLVFRISTVHQCIMLGLILKVDTY